MGSMNKVILIGNLGRDAEMKYIPNGTAVSTFSIATTETWKDKDGQKKEDTQWHRIVLWGKAAESLNDYLTKGKSIAVEGKMVTRKWEKDGQTHYTTEVKADRITLLGGRNDGSGGGRARGGHMSDEAVGGEMGSGSEADAGEAVGGSVELNDDDIPF